ncbi:aminoglycoside phosphotransferase family protein [Streptomyces sp. BE20]|uniref:aminoglycoside phosphotransferase family protein n=1 Tax=Streptomyces sp. BE20 TaxID=3002525 RepID=UPI002E7647E8|nr:aminoglycoside phosphotransferase family protein [Streptomyces sp. BE20]MEE1822341.1 aminoglycoside phosphotransferase family protein [Streptomyces sp. BE20]
MSAAPGQITVPAWLARSVVAGRGEEGRRWVAELPDRVAAQLARRDLTLERILDPGGSLSLVAYVHRDDLSPAVLKIGLRTPETAREPDALAVWAGRGAVLLLEADPAEGVLLLERLHGEIPLRSLAEPKAMLEATSLLHRLWVPLPEGHPFPLLADRTAGTTEALHRHRGLPGAGEADTLVTEALETAEGLTASATEEFLLHGDFHHGNVLAADRAPWLTIDPRPLAGERAYDLARLTLDRADTLIGSPGVPAAVRRRLHQLADALEVDRERLRGWTLVRAVELGLGALAADRRPDAELYLEFAGAL